MPKTLQQKLNKLLQKNYDLDNKLNELVKDQTRIVTVCYEALLFALEVTEGVQSSALVAAPKIRGALDLIEGEDFGQWASEAVNYQQLKRALKRAIDVYQYASMTRYEREVTESDRAYAERILAKAMSKK